MKIVIAGGHHSSALPVIHELNRQFPDVQIIWLGHKYSLKGDKTPTLEFYEVTALGIPFYEVKAGKLYKTFNLGRLLKVPFGFFQSLILLIKIKPDIILSFGGYLAVPVVMAGWLLQIPSVTHEQTVAVGYANKLIAKFAKKILISWPQSQKYFPGKNTVLTGLPLRKEIHKVITNSFDVNISIPTVYLTAGKTGSVKINEFILKHLDSILQNVNLIHQCGDHSVYKYFERLSSRYDQIKGRTPGRYHVRKFVFDNEIGEAYGKSNFVISRAGAHTVSELLALEKPAILIPIPWVSHNEQYKNAKLLSDAGLAVILDEANSEQDLMPAIRKMSYEYKNFTLKDDALKKLINMDSARIIAYETLSQTQNNF